MGFFSRRIQPDGERASSSDPQHAKPNAAELGWIAENLDRATALNIDIDNAAEIAGLYDELIRESADARSVTSTDPNVSINMIGILFGQHLVQRTEMRWSVVTDENGTELAIHDQKSDFLMVPANLVAKRWVQRQTGEFLITIADDVARRTSE